MLAHKFSHWPNFFASPNRLLGEATRPASVTRLARVQKQPRPSRDTTWTPAKVPVHVFASMQTCNTLLELMVRAMDLLHSQEQPYFHVTILQPL